MSALTDTVLIRDLSHCDYTPVWEAMRHFTDTRTHNTPDEIWLVEHNPVFTQGQNGRAEHILNPSNIPVVQTDRGGQVTYHGPGQLVVYVLIDLRRLKLTIRQLVRHLENSVIACLGAYGIEAKAREDAPGVYVNNAKICSLGLRVRKGCCYHGLAFNYDMDLSAFSCINPCGFKALRMTQLKDLGVDVSKAQLAGQLVDCLTTILGYNRPSLAGNELPTTQDTKDV